MKNLKRLGVLFSLMMVFFVATAAKADETTTWKINGAWMAMHEEQDGNMTTTTLWKLDFDSEKGTVNLVLSLDTSGIKDFLVFMAEGTYVLNGNQLVMDWNVKGSKLEFNQFAELMFGDQKEMAKKGMMEQFREELKNMHEAQIEDMTDRSFVYVDPDGTRLDFTKL